MSAKTPAERKADERARRKQLGLVRAEVWVLPENVPELHRFVARLDPAGRPRGTVEPVSSN